MKKKYLLFTVIFVGLVASCHDLTLEPKGQLGEAELFGNESGVRTYFTRLYNLLPIEDFVYYANNNNDHRDQGGGGYRPDNYWEAGKNSLGNMSGEFVNSWMKVNNDGGEYWSYNQIRDVNTFIGAFPKYKDGFSTETYNSILGEAHFLRAFYYSGMAKRYGGIPVINKVQDPYGDPDALNVKRNTEYDTWKFIHDDLQFAIDNMGANSEKGRANKYVAAALMSRTMLYAGSIARYTKYLEHDDAATVQGLAGIDESKAKEFFQYSYDAGKIIEESGKYALYTAKYPDKATNYAYIFQDENSSENIFIKDYGKDVPGDTRLRHSYDALMCPQPDMSSFVGAESYPSYDFLKLFDFPAITEADGTPKRWDKRDDFKADIEPRLRGIAYFDGDQLRGATFDIQRGLYKTFKGLATDIQDGSNDAPINKDGNRILGARYATYDHNGTNILIAGRHGMYAEAGIENNCWTGAFVRKYINEAMTTPEVREYQSGQPWIVFRLGEIYMNQAEACYELSLLGETSKKAEAFDYIEKIRDRAGCKVTRPADNTSNVQADYGYIYPIDGNLKFIRDERYRELAFENHRWWDIRRWRTATEDLKEWRPRVFMAYHVLDEDKYIYLDERENWNQNWNAEKKVYYQAIPQGEVNKNNNLLPNNPLR
ncbi:glycan metabolism protein RagB [Bacteroidia bacterium]|nr:glycan metabolism protein RagB [Bacteroidia bacterium]